MGNMNKVDGMWLVELTQETVTKVNDILTMDHSQYLKTFGCENDRVEKDKISKAQTMISTLKFFLDKVAPIAEDGKTLIQD